MKQFKCFCPTHACTTPAPHMRPFVPCRCVRLIEEDPPSKPKRFLLGLIGSMNQRDCGAMREVVKRETAAQRER
jgi:hypothetical protein